jgi:hypothetical protein
MWLTMADNVYCSAVSWALAVYMYIYEAKLEDKALP